MLRLRIELDREQEGRRRWFAVVVHLPGVMSYGSFPDEAVGKAKVLTLEVISNRLLHNEDPLTGCVDGSSAVAFEGLEFLGP